MTQCVLMKFYELKIRIQRVTRYKIPDKVVLFLILGNEGLRCMDRFKGMWSMLRADL